jgi:hypothetical protein
MPVIYFMKLENPAFFDMFEKLSIDVPANAAAWDIDPLVAGTVPTAFNIYKPLNLAIRNKKTRTQIQVDDHIAGRIVAEAFIKDFANEYLINNSLISTSILESLGFNRTDGERHERPVIEETPFSKVDALEGSRVQFTNRTDEDASRASVHADADGLEVRYAIGTTPPATWEDCPEKEFSSKAKFTTALGPANAGKKIYAFLRWRNNSNPEKSGPFGDMITTTIRS